MSNKIKKIEPEMEYPDYMGEESLQNLKDNPFSGFQTHDLSFVMAMVIRKINEFVDAVNAPGDKGPVSENSKKSILQEDGEVLNGDRSIDYGDMKKYWIKDLTKKQVIHAPTEEIARKLCDKFHEMGLQWSSGDPYSGHSHWDGFEEETCYLPSEGQFCGLSYYTEQGYEILTIDQLLDFQANEYPKVMEVSNSIDKNDWRKRVVFMEKNGKFLAWNSAESIEEAEHEVYTSTWSYAREIQPTPALELTIDQIAEKFNVSPEQIKIKK